MTVRRIRDRPMPGRAHSSNTTTSRHDSRSKQREPRRHSSTSACRSRSERTGGRHSGPSPGVEHLGERDPGIPHHSRAERDRSTDISRTQDARRHPPSTITRPLVNDPPEPPSRSQAAESEPERPASGVAHLEAEEVTQPDNTGVANLVQEDMAQKDDAGVANSAQKDVAQTDNAGVANSAQEDTIEIAAGGVEYSAQPATTEGSGAEDSVDITSEDELTRTGDDCTLGDRSLLTRVIGQPPTSLRLHFIRDAWDALILHEIRATDSEAEQLKARATLYPTGSRVWRLLREEARRLQQHGALSRVWLSNRVEPPGPHIPTPRCRATEDTEP